MHRAIAAAALLLMVFISQASSPESGEKASVSARAHDFGDAIGDAAARLAKIRKQLREATHEITTPSAIIILSIDNIQTALFYEATQLQDFSYVAPAQKTRWMYISKSAETWKTFIRSRIESCLNMIQKNAIHIADAERLRLIDQAKETIENAVKLVDDAILYLETEFKEPPE